MKRSSFFKSLAALVAAPSVLAKIKVRDAPIKPIQADKSLFKDLQFVVPVYYKEYVEKYSNEDFTWWVAECGKNGQMTHSRNFFYYESGVVKHSPMAGEPVTITITKDDYA